MGHSPSKSAARATGHQPRLETTEARHLRYITCSCLENVIILYGYLSIRCEIGSNFTIARKSQPSGLYSC